MRAYFNAMRRYATFTGRTSRAEFWRAHIVLMPLILVAFGGLGLPFASGSRSVWPLLFFVLIVGPHAVPWAALVVRRLHDMGFRGWWALVGLLPLIPIVPLGVIVLLAWGMPAWHAWAEPVRPGNSRHRRHRGHRWRGYHVGFTRCTLARPGGRDRKARPAQGYGSPHRRRVRDAEGTGARARGGRVMTVLLALALYAAVAAFYVLPSILAWRRRHPNRWLILAVNLFLGPPGWVVALVWVLYATLRPFQVGGSGNPLTLGGGVPARGEAASPSPADPLSAADAGREIERLSRLREAGHLTEGEYASLKAGVLGRH